MADKNILELNETTEPVGSYLYVVIDGQDFYISYENFLKLFEPILGLPSENGQVLSSTIQGIRSWKTITAETGASIKQKLEALAGNARLDVSAVKGSCPTPPSNDNKAYAMYNGVWTEISIGDIDSSNVRNADALSNIGTAANATQSEINAAIDAKMVSSSITEVALTWTYAEISAGIAKTLSIGSYASQSALGIAFSGTANASEGSLEFRNNNDELIAVLNSISSNLSASLSAFGSSEDINVVPNYIGYNPIAEGTSLTLYFYMIYKGTSVITQLSPVTNYRAILQDQLATPVIGTITAVSSTELNVPWSASANATGYKLEWSANGTTGWTQIGGTITATSYNHTGLTGSTTYYYRVTALFSDPEGAYYDSEVSAVGSGTTESAITEQFIDSWTGFTGTGQYNATTKVLNSSDNTGTVALANLKLVDGSYITCELRDTLNEPKGWLFGVKSANIAPGGWGTWDLDLAIGYTFSAMMYGINGSIEANGPAPALNQKLRISRSGNTITADYTTNGGTSWTTLHSITMTGDAFVAASMGSGGGVATPAIYNAKSYNCQTV